MTTKNPIQCPFCHRDVPKYRSCYGCGCDVNNKALKGAFKKGYEAPLDQDNPYKDHRTHVGRVTFSRAFISAWDKGRAHRIKVEGVPLIEE